MNKRIWVWGGAVLVVIILIGLLRPGKHSVPVTAPVKFSAGPITKFVHHLKRPLAELPAPPVAQPVGQPAMTNAASIYQEAFARLGALHKTANLERLGDPNLPPAVVAEFCEKLHPICDLLHQASTLTNCDWGLGKADFTTPFIPIVGSPTKVLVKTAFWSATHCHENDATAATDDIVSVLRLGQQVSKSDCGLLGYRVDMEVQEMVWAHVAANLDKFPGSDGERLMANFDDIAYDETFKRALEQDAGIWERSVAKLTALAPAAAEKALRDLSTIAGPLNQTDGIARLTQLADLERGLANVLTTGSEANYAVWLQRYHDLQATDPLVKALLPIDTMFAKAQAYEVNRSLMEAGLAVAVKGTAGLATYPDPSTGAPFTYRAVPGGFELQSNYQVNNQPLKIFFPQSATRK